jgi:hypothetical protein
MRSSFCVYGQRLTPESRNSGARGDGRYNTIKTYVTCDMTTESRNRAFRGAPRRRPLPDNGSVIRSSSRSDKFFMVLASTVILGSESRGTQEHILLSPDSGSRATPPVRPPTN